jgi:hypothetical protein
MTVSAEPMVIRGKVIAPPQLAFSRKVGVSGQILVHVRSSEHHIPDIIG